MTKQRRTVTLSKELDDIIALLASAKQMNYSEFLETRLRILPEVTKTIERLNAMSEEPVLTKTMQAKPQKIKNKKTSR
jgi:hypothetical protein